MTRFALIFTAFSLTFAACGGQVEPPPRAATSAAPERSANDVRAPARPPLTRRAQIFYELDGRAFPLPLVRGTVGGVPTLMLIDTGANSHVVAGWLARKLKMKLDKLGDIGSDHAGRAVVTYRVDHPRVVIEGWGAIGDGPMLVTDVPPLLEKLGIGVFISPQRLVEEGDAVVLDLAAGDLYAAYYDEATRALEARTDAPSSITAIGTRTCSDTASAIQGLAFIVVADVDGHKADLLVDSGAPRSDLLASSEVGRALAPYSAASREQMIGASGAMTSRTLKSAKITVGDYVRATDVDLIPGSADPFCARDGVVSMDVLRACTLVLGRAHLEGRCR